jgi:anti-sigma28 factor (negative regulator of flagellin synthesis)
MIQNVTANAAGMTASELIKNDRAGVQNDKKEGTTKAENRIESLKKAIESGEYAIDLSATARKMAEALRP